MAGNTFTRCPYCGKLLLVGQPCPYSTAPDHREKEDKGK